MNKGRPRPPVRKALGCLLVPVLAPKGIFVFAMINYIDVEQASYNWNLNPYGYAVRNTRKCDGPKTQPLFMHRCILGLRPNDGKLGDHRNRNTLDNRRKNLRVYTKSGNAFNSKIRCDSTTRIRGVGIHKPSGRYRAYITVNQRMLHLGLYDSLRDATTARKEAESKYLGVQ